MFNINCRKFYKSLLFAFAFLSCAPLIAEEEEQDSWTMDSINPIKRDEIEHRLKPLGFGLMGDTIDTDKGAVVFNVTDVSIPGDSKLEVALRRKTGGWSYNNGLQHYMADWIVEVPSVSVLVRAGLNWQNNRCSRGTNDILTYSGEPTGIDDLLGTEISALSNSKTWSAGYKLNIPGKGSKFITRGWSAEAQASQSRWSTLEYNPDSKSLQEVGLRRFTTDNWVISCGVDAHGDTNINSQSSQYTYTSAAYGTTETAQDADGPGEGFIVTSPDGTKYTMSRLHYFPAAPYINPNGLVRSPFVMVERHMATLMATKVEDVLGNWVKYEYSDDGRLERIHGSDGREINISYHSNSYRISSVTTNGRTWTYSYSDYTQQLSGTAPASTVKVLTKVIQPDGNAWTYNMGNLTRNLPGHTYNDESTKQITISHPYGMTAEYDIDDGWAERDLSTIYDWQANYAQYGAYKKVKTVSKKTLSGASTPTSIWTYEKSLHNGRYLSETNPAGFKTKYTYQSIGSDTGACDIAGTVRKLIEVEKYDNDGSTVIETTTNFYTDGDDFIFSNYEDIEKSPVCAVYLTRSVTDRGNDTYTVEYDYDTDPHSSTYSYGKPITETRYSNVSTTKQNTVYTYIENKDMWILGLPESVTINGRDIAIYEHDFFGRKTKETKFGSSAMTFDYHCYSFNIFSFTDANKKTTYAHDYYRGIPRRIERPDKSFSDATVDDNGWITGVMDFNGYWTTYERDDMGRLKTIIPSKLEKNWLNTNISYTFGDEVEQVITRGNKRETITYDNLLRVIQEHSLDTSYNTSIYKTYEFNAAGQLSFESFPSLSANPSSGLEKLYDAFGRIKSESENVSPFATTTVVYGDNHTKSVKDPEGATTIYSYSGYKGPDKGKLIKISHPEGATTTLYRNVWDQLFQLRQRGSENGYNVDVSQYYYYDSMQRVCRHTTAEGNSTLYEYNASGYLTSYEKGVDDGGNDCVSPSGTGKVSMLYNSLHKVTQVRYTDAPTLDFTYDNNGNVTFAGSWKYTYDELNHLTNERLKIDSKTYEMSYSYNTAGQMTSQTMPSGRTLSYVNDGLGRMKSIKSGSTYYADNISYHANNMIANLDYGNDHEYTQTLNSRMLPSRIWVRDSSKTAIDLRLNQYDSNRNLLDVVDGMNTSNNKTMTYDSMDRLISASGAWGRGTFKYDSLGNLRKKTLGSRSVTNSYNNTVNRVTSSLDSVNGKRVFEHDLRGNVTEAGSLIFTYDRSDMVVEVNGDMNAIYKYDGNQKRVKSIVNNETTYFIYNKAGQLIHIDNITTGEETDYILLGGKTIARISNDTPTYIHTDWLGTPLAGSLSDGTIRWREEFTPSGEKYSDTPINNNRDGFTGHVFDSGTGLTYMQARYYDPVIGRFYSNDPVDALGHMQRGNSITHGFNRYAYANNNPYKYTDPDGELVQFIVGAVIGAATTYSSIKDSDMSFTEAAGAMAVGTIVGGASGGIGTLINMVKGAGTVASLTTGALAGGGSEATTQLINSQEIDGVAIAEAALEGAVAAVSGNVVAGVTVQGNAKSQVAQEVKEQATTIVETATAGLVQMGVDELQKD